MIHVIPNLFNRYIHVYCTSSPTFTLYTKYIDIYSVKLKRDIGKIISSL